MIAYGYVSAVLIAVIVVCLTMLLHDVFSQQVRHDCLVYRLE